MIPRSILIIRLSAIGDIVMALPLLAALRASYPTATITWLVQPECRDLLTADPRLSEVLVWPKGEWLELWRQRRWLQLTGAVRSFRRELKHRKFDLVLDLQGLLKSALLARFTGAPERVGLGSREGSRMLMTRVVSRAGGDPQVIGSEYRHLASDLGLPPETLDMRIPLPPEDRDFAEQLVADRALSAGYAVLCPFTTRPQKHWFPEQWQTLIQRLADEHHLPSVILGGPADREAAHEIGTTSPAPVINLAGDTSLREAAAMIARASLLIGVDTGLTHMGIAQRTPTVALFGSTRPYLNTLSDSAEVLYHPLPCSPCRRHPTCNGEFTCMRLITPQQVLESAVRVTQGFPMRCTTV